MTAKSEGRKALAMAAAIGLGLTFGGQAAIAQSGDAARVKALKERIAELNEQARHVEDINQIHRLQRAYGYYIDKGFWGEASDLFDDDATLEVGVDGVYKGKAHIHKYLVTQGGGHEGPGLEWGQLNMHMQLQPVITVAKDGKTAKGRWRDFSLLGKYHVSAHWGDAEMENSYIKEDGVWKIKSMHVYTNFIAPYEGGWAKLEPVESKTGWVSETGKAFPADAKPTVTYKPFPNVFVPPFHYKAGRIAAIQAPAPMEIPDRPDDAIGKMEAAADVQELKLDTLYSERAIENLQAIYGFYIDKGMWDEAAALFTKDATYEFGQRGVYKGQKRVRDALTLMGKEGLEEGQLNNYPMLQPIISVAPDNKTAKARWRSDVQLSKDGKGKWGAGVYENEYVNVDGTWKLSKLHYYVTMWANYDTGWYKDALPMEPASTDNPPDAPPTMVYEALPKMVIFPYHYNHPVTGKPWSGE